MNKILVLGNSEKQSAIAEILGKHTDVMHFKTHVTPEAVAACDTVILPLPAARGEYITDSDIKISDIFTFDKKTYIGGRIGREFDLYRPHSTIIDYTNHKSFAQKNAYPSAEGAVMLAMRESPFTVHGSKCLITGFGRIGKALLPPLVSMGAEVFVAARRKEARTTAEHGGARTVDFNEIKTCGSFDTVFNTVPALVLKAEELKTVRPKLLIDLASGAGGCDFSAAESLKIKAIHALALPGKFFPETAAKITAETILSILNQLRNGDILNEH